MVEIRRVNSKRDKKKFINFENKLYEECDNFVPSIYKEEASLFSHKKNPNLISNETTAYLAFQDGKVAGRVLCDFNRIEKDKKNIIRFSHLDFINDSEVSFALFDVVEKWAKFLKSEKIIGDISFNDLGSIGILNSGYDKLSTFHHRYNYPYYSSHLKEYGYSINKKYKELQLELVAENIDNIDNIKELLEENNLKLVEGDKTYKIKNYGRKIFDLLYENSISGYPIVIEESVYENTFKKLNKLYTDKDFIIVINENDEVMGALLLTNNTSLALQTTLGKEVASKNNYNIDNSKYVDLSLYVSNNSIIMDKIMQILLAQAMKDRSNTYLNTNMWIEVFNEDLFKEVWHRERVLMSKTLKSSNVTRDKDSLAIQDNHTNTTTIK